MRIAELFGRDRPIFSFEFFPPKTPAGHDALIATIVELRQLAPDFVSVTYGAGGSTRDRTLDLVSTIKNEIGIEAMAHLTCVGAGRDELSSTLRRLTSAGIENVIALRGDPPKGETEFRPHPDGLHYAEELVGLIRREHPSICVAGACYPEKHIEAPSFEDDLNHLADKVRAGVDVLITQMFYDNTSYFRFVEKARALGITVPIVPGIMPISSIAAAERFGATVPESLRQRLEGHESDPKVIESVGNDFAFEQCSELLDGGAPGIHFYTLNKSPRTREILLRLRAAGHDNRSDEKV
jgi:methylenetetrahydrofolate reductase (NADPH)